MQSNQTKFCYHNGNITKLLDDEIFVFGSNLAGIHGAGAALYAKKMFGATQYVGVGFTGRCYAIPTKNERIEALSIGHIEQHIDLFISMQNLCYDALNPSTNKYLVTRIGCGLAGYADADIAPLFRRCNPSITAFDEKWREYLE